MIKLIDKQLAVIAKVDDGSRHHQCSCNLITLASYTSFHIFPVNMKSTVVKYYQPLFYHTISYTGDTLSAPGTVLTVRVVAITQRVAPHSCFISMSEHFTIICVHTLSIHNYSSFLLRNITHVVDPMV